MTDRVRFEQAIAALEAQRVVLGDAVVDSSIGALRAQLAALDPPPVEAQRKLATILFADVSGFTALSETLDPEDIAAVMNALWERLDAVVVAHGGRIDKHIGDALMALWGADAAREDDPEQAVRAALGMQQALAAFREERGLALAMRIGVNTGPVLLGSVGSTREFTAMGDTVNLASRMEHAAPVGGILIAHDTYRHIRGLFDVASQEPRSVKGKAELVLTYIVTAAKARAFHMSTRGVESIATRTIGREAELLALQSVYRDAAEGRETRLITVVGDAGVGKSRLLSELEQWVDLRPEPVWLFRARALPETLHRPGGLLRDLLIFRCEIQDADPSEVMRMKIAAGLAPALDANQAAVLGQAAGFDFGDVPAAQAAISGAGFTNMAAAYLATYLGGLAESGPVLVLLEDLHWADDRSLDLLDAALERLANRRLLVVGLARPPFFERRPDWGAGQPYSARIDLRPLSLRASRTLVDEILQRVVDLPEALCATIVAQAEGNPFYVEELVKVLIERGVIVRGAGDAPWAVHAEQLATVAVPATLVGVLQARLDSLPSTEKATLQRASVLGRAFWDAAVAALTDTPPDMQVPAALGGLRARELVFRRERSTFAEAQEYIFKHALLREVSYESVLKRQRRDYHAQAALWLEQAAGARADEYAALIADHYALAEERAAEGRWQARAGRQAAAQHAHDEALRRLGRALELLPADDHATRYMVLLAREKVYSLRGEREPQAADLEALEVLAVSAGDRGCQADVAIRWSMYYEAISTYPAAIAAALRVLAQAEAGQARHALARLCWGRALWGQGNLTEARGQAELAIALARAASDQVIEIDGLRQFATIVYELGDQQLGRSTFLQALEAARSCGDRQGEAYALDSLSQCARDQSEWDMARAYSEQAVDIQHMIGNRDAEAGARFELVIQAFDLGDYATARTNAEQSLRIFQEIGNRHSIGWALCMLGQIARNQGVWAAACAYTEQTLEVWQAIDNRRDENWALTLLGRLACDRGDYLAARAYAERSLEVATGNPWGKCAALRVLGHAAWAQGDYPAAQTCYEQALAIFRAGEGARALGSLVLHELGHLRLEQGLLVEAAGLVEEAAVLRSAVGHASVLAESWASLACVLHAQGDLPGAQAQVEMVLMHLATKNLDGAEAPMRAYLCCYEVLQAAGDSRAHPLLERAHHELMAQAEQFGKVDRHTFLEHVPWNWAIGASWAARDAEPAG